MSNTVAWNDYLNRFEEIINSENPEPPYNIKEYFNYLKLNASRQKRWLKKGELQNTIKEKVKQIEEHQTWYVITEPWCGDAAHSIPFIYMITELNENIELKIVWRDRPPLMINDYLTKGGKSVPKLIVKDANGKDLFTWGPRPEPCQKLYYKLKDKNADFEEMKIELQQWYNNDKGQTLQRELEKLINSKL